MTWHRPGSTSTSRSARRSATTATSIAACTTMALRRRYVDALVADIRSFCAIPTIAGRHDFLRRRHAVAARTRGAWPHHPGVPRQLRARAPTPKSPSKPIPSRLRRRSLEAFRAAGANRLSFGVQSFRDEELRRLGPAAFVARPRATAVRAARAAGFDNLSLDLMMWLPGQSTDGLAGVGGRADRPRSPITRRCICWRFTRMRRCGTKWRAAAGRWRRTMMRRRCIWKGWRGSIAPASSSMKFRTWPGRRRAARVTILKYWQEGEWLGFGCGAHATFRRRAVAHRSVRRPTTSIA